MSGFAAEERSVKFLTLSVKLSHKGAALVKYRFCTFVGRLSTYVSKSRSNLPKVGRKDAAFGSGRAERVTWDGECDTYMGRRNTFVSNSGSKHLKYSSKTGWSPTYTQKLRSNSPNCCNIADRCENRVRICLLGRTKRRSSKFLNELYHLLNPIAAGYQ